MKTYDTKAESKSIKDFLKVNSDILRFNGIERRAKISKDVLSHLVTGITTMLHPATIKKLVPILVKCGFDPNNFYEYEKVIIDEVTKAYNYPISKKQLLGNPRKREVVIARQICMVYRNCILNMSQQNNSNRYGKDHATVIHAKNTFSNLKDSDKKYRQMISNIESRLKCKFVI